MKEIKQLFCIFLLFVVVAGGVFRSGVVAAEQARESASGVDAGASGLAKDDPGDVEPKLPSLHDDLLGGIGFWWILLFFIVACGLLLWLVWQNRHGVMFTKSGGENIDIVARRMFGPRHGVICVRLRDREFLLGIGGDGITLLSEWRQKGRAGMADREEFDAALLGTGEKGGSAAEDR